MSPARLSSFPNIFILNAYPLSFTSPYLCSLPIHTCLTFPQHPVRPTLSCPHPSSPTAGVAQSYISAISRLMNGPLWAAWQQQGMNGGVLGVRFYEIGRGGCGALGDAPTARGKLLLGSDYPGAATLPALTLSLFLIDCASLAMLARCEPNQTPSAPLGTREHQTVSWA